MRISGFLPALLVLTVSSATADQRASEFYANVAQSVITPPIGTFMVEPRGKASTGVHDDLYVKAVALGDGKNTFVIVSFDLVGFDDLLVERIRKAVLDAAGIEAGRLMLSCTHTHNAPITFDAMHAWHDDLETRDRQWEERMIATTADTVRRAAGNLRRVSIDRAGHPVQIGLNRRLSLSTQASMRPNPHGPALTETDVVTIKDKESVIAILFSYAAHPVSVHSGSSEFSADFPGYAARYLESRYPGSVALFLQGCGGNVNSPLRTGYAGAELEGNRLGEAVSKGVESSKPIQSAPLVYGQRDFYLPFMDIDTETAELVIKRIEESFTTIREENPAFKPGMSQRDLVHWAQRMRDWAEKKHSQPGLPFHAQAVALGRSLAILAYPDEVFVDYALFLKKHSPFEQTIVLGYANGCRSYVPSGEAFYLGGYEPGSAQAVYGQPYLTPACDRIIKAESMKLLHELWERASER